MSVLRLQISKQVDISWLSPFAQDTIICLFQGTVIIRRKQMKTVKYQADGTPVNRQVAETVMLHEDIIGSKFWEDNPDVLS